jgi:hypothetical protein
MKQKLYKAVLYLDEKLHPFVKITILSFIMPLMLITLPIWIFIVVCKYTWISLVAAAKNQ